jgi:hypothetical protein
VPGPLVDERATTGEQLNGAKTVQRTADGVTRASPYYCYYYLLLPLL